MFELKNCVIHDNIYNDGLELRSSHPKSEMTVIAADHKLRPFTFFLKHEVRMSEIFFFDFSSLFIPIWNKIIKFKDVANPD